MRFYRRHFHPTLVFNFIMGFVCVRLFHKIKSFASSRYDSRDVPTRQESFFLLIVDRFLNDCQSSVTRAFLYLLWLQVTPTPAHRKEESEASGVSELEGHGNGGCPERPPHRPGLRRGICLPPIATSTCVAFELGSNCNTQCIFVSRSFHVRPSRNRSKEASSYHSSSVCQFFSRPA